MAAVTDDTQTETAVPLFTVYIITYFWPVPTIGPGVGYTDSREIYRTARKILKYVGPKPIEKTVNAQELKDMKELDGGSKLLRYCDPKLILGPDDWRLNAPDLLGEESDEDEDNNDEDEENLHSDGGLEDMFATNGCKFATRKSYLVDPANKLSSTPLS